MNVCAGLGRPVREVLGTDRRLPFASVLTLLEKDAEVISQVATPRQLNGFETQLGRVLSERTSSRTRSASSGRRKTSTAFSVSALHDVDDHPPTLPLAG